MCKQAACDRPGGERDSGVGRGASCICAGGRRGYPPDIRKAIYTTNAIESLNSVIRAAIKKRKVFPTDDSVRKVIYLAIQSASKKWSMPIQNWRLAMSRFIIEFGDRLSDHR